MNAYGRLITHRLFVIYWGGATLVQLALQFVTIALAWFVLETTGSALRVVFILAVIPVARMATSLWVGHLMDRFLRRSLMILENASQMLLYASVPDDMDKCSHVSAIVCCSGDGRGVVAPIQDRTGFPLTPPRVGRRVSVRQRLVATTEQPREFAEVGHGRTLTRAMPLGH